MRFGMLIRSLSVMVPLVVGLAPTGCGNFLNPDLFNAVLGTGDAARLPNDAPAIVLAVENQTARVVETRLSWREGSADVGQQVFVVQPGQSQSLVLVCPVTEITLGDVTNLQSTGAVVRLGTGAAADPIIEVEPFGVLLQEGVTFECGDAVTLAVVPSGATRSGYRIFGFVEKPN